jgi:hypothetical protein
MSVPDSVLDNPVWHALTGPHAYLAEGDDRARCYPSDTSWGAAVRTQDADAYARLARLLPPGRPVGLFTSPPPPDTPFRVVREHPAVQMVCARPMPGPADHGPAIIPLTAADVPAMLRLVALTEPGPLLPRSIDLGPFLSIQEEGEVPFLHVAADHHDVIAWYGSLGFVRRTDLFIFGVERI